MKVATGAFLSLLSFVSFVSFASFVGLVSLLRGGPPKRSIAGFEHSEQIEAPDAAADQGK